MLEFGSQISGTRSLRTVLRPVPTGSRAPLSVAEGSAAAPTYGVLVVEPRQFMRECLAGWVSSNVPHVRVLQADTMETLHRSADFRGDTLDTVHLMLISVFGVGLSRWLQEPALRPPAATGTPFVLIGEYADSGSIREALAAGASGFIPSSLGLRVAGEAIKLVLAGGTFLPPAILDPEQGQGSSATAFQTPSPANTQDGLGGVADMSAEGHPDFTPREQDVLEALLEGKPNKLIAHELDLRESTVKVHVRHIMRKLNVTNRTQVAVRMGRFLRRG